MHAYSTVPDSAFSKWASKWFKNVDIPSPMFRMCGKDIKVLAHPEDFYKELLCRCSNAKKRITLASLYLGNGHKEEKLVDAIYQNLESSVNHIDFNVLLEYTRGSRGTKNSRTLLLPFLKDFPEKTKVALFHTPNLRGILKSIIPARFDETVNVAHLKVYLFDDTLIMSGANLSHDYFTNRQDRYIIFEDCKELCDYFQDLVKTISRFSFLLQHDDSVELDPLFFHHPFLGSKRMFNKEASNLLQKFTKKYSQYHSETDLRICEDTDYDSGKNNEDTIVFPLIQMRTFGITQDEEVTKNIIDSAPSNTNLLLATAYFNLTDDYWKAILDTKTDIDLIMAHPKAMGFYKAKGLAGGIPNAYSLISKQRYKDLMKKNCTKRVRFLEYYREGWTFHGKGLWAHLDKCDNGHFVDNCSSPHSPFLTLIGSPNFGKRSVYRDMEAQVGIVTRNHELIDQLINERDHMKNNTTTVNIETYKEKERMVYWWVYLITTIMNELF